MTARRDTRPPLVRASRVLLGVILGMFAVALAQVAFGGTVFSGGDKVGTCQGSTCSSSSGGSGSGGATNNGGSGGAGGSATVTTAIVNAPTVTATNQTTVTASPRSSATSRSASTARSRSVSRSRATGGNATATGGSATASNGSQTTTITVSGARAADLGDRVPDIVAPGLATGGDDVCLGSVSGGLGLSGIGAMFGLTLVDDHCQTIKAVKLLTAMGRQGAAIRRACMDDKMREALGDECPTQPQESPRAPAAVGIH